MAVNWLEKQGFKIFWNRSVMKNGSIRRWVPLIAVAYVAVILLLQAWGFTGAADGLRSLGGAIDLESKSPVSGAEIGAAAAMLAGVVLKILRVLNLIGPIDSRVENPSRFDKPLVLAFLLLLPAFASAGEQFGVTNLDITTPRGKRPFTASFETGLASTWTNGVKDERAAVIAFADVPYKRGGSATRIDIAGSRGQQTVDLSNPQTFRSAEILTALYFEALSGVDAICFGGVGLSIEGSKGAPLDTRMYTGGCGVRVRAFKQTLLAGWGQRGSIQGQGFLGSLHLTKGDKTRVHIDGAIRARSLVTGRRPWELRSSATVVVWKR